MSVNHPRPRQPSEHDGCCRYPALQSRTLRRKLSSEGWHYQQLIDQVRVIRARRALSDPTQSVTQVALQVGYADHSGFLRAFRKWTGLTPSEFRSKLFD
ncbi:helix-turn-helix transcriptional regulator [Denitrificimonas caeni]|uniref:helix-turn-helix transcriptional regulator n=1 Tax=Denitrificimonas caeni TaxID=521720 RepID=UPI003B28DC24